MYSFTGKWGGKKKKEALIKVYICVRECDGNDIASQASNDQPYAYRELSSDFQEVGEFNLMIFWPDDDCFVK